jgi:hypothetical protein
MTKLGATTHPLHPKFFIPIRNIHREKSSGSSIMMLYQFHPLLGKASSNPGGGEPPLGVNYSWLVVDLPL